MAKLKQYPYGLPYDVRFIKVKGKDGIFYDAARLFNVNKHIAQLKKEGYAAKIIARNSVPPCIFRDFTDGLNKYSEAQWKKGKKFYFTR